MTKRIVAPEFRSTLITTDYPLALSFGESHEYPPRSVSDTDVTHAVRCDP